ncbi:MAG: cytidylate kinase-like family protein, partial [Bacteroidales bacterium]
MDNLKFVITIGRQYGSGGREVGRILAEKLGVNFYDKELVYQSANLIGVDGDYLAHTDEKAPSFMDSIFSSPVGFGGDFYLLGGFNQGDNNYNIIADTVRRLADEGSSIMVGRTADYLLREHNCCVSLFIHASLEKRVERIMERVEGITAEAAEARAIKNDRNRA